MNALLSATPTVLESDTRCSVATQQLRSLKRAPDQEA